MQQAKYWYHLATSGLSESNDTRGSKPLVQFDITLNTVKLFFEMPSGLPDPDVFKGKPLKTTFFNQEIKMFIAANFSPVKRRLGRALVLATSILSVLLLAGCVASAKVYNNDKTVVYNGATYNLANVKQIKSKISGKLSDTNTVDLSNADKKQIEAYLKEYKTIYVRMAFNFDDQEMLYRASSVSKWSDYSKMKNSFDDAGKQINSLMADKKKLQIKLK